jgi:hypothetical protein
LTITEPRVTNEELHPIAQGEADPGAAGGGILPGVDPTPMLSNDVAGNGQPQDDAAGVTRLSEPLEHLVELVLPERRAGVRDQAPNRIQLRAK